MENKNIRLLTKDDIDVKVKKIIDGKALLLLYKTARTDMAILDETFGAENWQDDYKEIKGNMYCGIGIYSKDKNEWIWKWDCGIESREDEDGNQKKGEASDAFKRAGFKVGIGRELYTAPVVFVEAETVADGKFFKLKDRYAKYSVKTIEYNENKEITKLVIVDRYNKQVFPKNYNNNEEQPKPTPKQKETTPTAEQIAKRKQELETALLTSKLTPDDVKKWVSVKTKTTKAVAPELLSEDLFKELISAIMNPKNQKPKEVEQEAKKVDEK